MTARVSASRIIDASPDEVFSTVIDLARLPEWNTAITAVNSLGALEAAAGHSTSALPGTNTGGDR